MKRSKATKFMPNGYVFPGGVSEKTDESTEWMELYKSLGVEQFTEITSVKGLRPFIFQKKEVHAIPRLSKHVNNMYEMKTLLKSSFISERYHYGLLPFEKRLRNLVCF